MFHEISLNFCKIITHALNSTFSQILHKIHQKFKKKISNIFKISRKFFRIFPLFFSKFLQILLKTNAFSQSAPYWHFLSSFCKFLNFFFKDLLSLNKVTVEICPNFYSGLFKNFPANFGSVFNFFYTQIIFLKKLIISNLFCFNFILCFVALFTKTTVFSKFFPKFHKLYLKFCQTLSKIYPKQCLKYYNILEF